MDNSNMELSKRFKGCASDMRKKAKYYMNIYNGVGLIVSGIYGDLSEDFIVLSKMYFEENPETRFSELDQNNLKRKISSHFQEAAKEQEQLIKITGNDVRIKIDIEYNKLQANVYSN